MSSKKYIARKRPWKFVRLDGELYSVLEGLKERSGWRFDMTKFIEDVLWKYTKGQYFDAINRGEEPRFPFEVQDKPHKKDKYK